MSNVIIGKTYGNLTVLESLGLRETSTGKKREWVKCRCEICGNPKYEILATSLLQLRTISCGCLRYTDDRAKLSPSDKAEIIADTNFTIAELSEIYGVCRETIRRIKKSGNGIVPTKKPHKNPTRIPPDELIGKQFGRLTVKEILESKNGNRRVRCECSCQPNKYVDVWLYNIKRKASQSCGCLRKDNAKRVITLKERADILALNDLSDTDLAFLLGVSSNTIQQIRASKH